jgi:hypothetical protein
VQRRRGSSTREPPVLNPMLVLCLCPESGRMDENKVFILGHPQHCISVSSQRRQHRSGPSRPLGTYTNSFSYISCQPLVMFSCSNPCWYHLHGWPWLIQALPALLFMFVMTVGYSLVGYRGHEVSCHQPRSDEPEWFGNGVRKTA